ESAAAGEECLLAGVRGVLEGITPLHQQLLGLGWIWLRGQGGCRDAWPTHADEREANDEEAGQSREHTAPPFIAREASPQRHELSLSLRSLRARCPPNDHPSREPVGDAVTLAKWRRRFCLDASP